MDLRPTQGDEKRGLDFPVTHRTVIPTEAKRRDLLFSGPLLEMFSTERSGEICGFLFAEFSHTLFRLCRRFRATTPRAERMVPPS
jgi:hypothetical protein